MSRIAETFARLGGQPALVTYIACGDPDLKTTLGLMHALADSGSDIIELGVPFTDPMADGPVIQAAVERALKNNVTLPDVLDTVAAFRKQNTATPVVLMGYLNPVFRMGYERFSAEAAKAGVDGVLTVDSPAEASDELCAALEAEGLDCIFLIAPTTTDERIELIARKAGGFVYYVSLKGVTGSAQLDTEAVSRKISGLRRFVTVPVGVGFGIRDAESARKVAQTADAVIVGSRIVQTVHDNPGREIETVSRLVSELKAAVTR